jgi:dihydrofolate reductase
MMIAIVAMSENRVIGHNGMIPWKLSKDMQFFRRTTTGHVIVMGRKTYDSIGRPLPGRENIVISRTALAIDGVQCITDPALIPVPGDAKNLFIIGGAEIYGALMPRCDEVLLTLVKREVEGDTFFPVFEDDFKLSEIVEADDEMEIRRYVRSSNGL